MRNSLTFEISYKHKFLGLKNLLFFFMLASATLNAWAGGPLQQQIDSTRSNSKEQQAKPYVIMISADGYRYDFDKLYDAQYLQHLKSQGVSATYMNPSFPSLTFPNHYSLATGLYPAHHGLIGNDFEDLNKDRSYSSKVKTAYTDSSWYGGTPIWVLAEQQKMLTASFYWVGSEAAIRGVRPTYWYPYSESISIDERVKIVYNWLMLPEEKRPHLITFYLPQVDQAAHTYGPESMETRTAVGMVDYALAKLTNAAKSTGLNVNFVFVSDHGLIKVNNQHPISIAGFKSKTNEYVLTGGGNLMALHLKDSSRLDDIYNRLKKNAAGYRVYTKYNTPAYWHYGAKDDFHDLLGDIMIEAIAPNYFSDKKPKPGQHGYDPRTVPEMRASFAAWGPAFKEKLVIKPFNNVDVYPLVAHILDLSIGEKIDGNLEVLKPVLK